jgi:hypothetical protein
MGRPRKIIDEFTDLPISEAAKYQRRELKRNPDQTRTKRRTRQSTPEYIARRKVYMAAYHQKRKSEKQ